MRQRVAGAGLQLERGLHAADMRLHEFFGFRQVALFKRLHDLHMLFARLRRIVRRLVEHGDECGARGEVAQRVGQQAVAQAFGQAHMKVAQQKAAQAHVVAFDGGFLAGEVAFELFDGGLAHVAGAADQAHLDHAARLKGLACFFLRRLNHIPAAPAAHGDDAAHRQPGEGFTHDGAAAVKQHGQLLLAQACARRELLRHHGFNDAVGDVCCGGHAPCSA
jgi:hypothetical protein